MEGEGNGRERKGREQKEIARGGKWNGQLGGGGVERRGGEWMSREGCLPIRFLDLGMGGRGGARGH